MSSMNNNWLGFSLSPQHHLPTQPNPNNIHHHLHQDSVDVVSRLPTAAYNSDEISSAATDVSGECFADLTLDSSIPSLNHLPPPFGILEAFNRTTPSQDWNLKDMRMNSFSCNSSHQNEERPKLENFLGVGTNINSFTDHHHLNNGYNVYQENHHGPTTKNSGGSTIGLSMIKNWLRNNPAAAPPENKAADSETAAPGQIQSLSLSMSTGSQTSSPLPLMNGNALESCTSESSKLQQVAVESCTQSGAVMESVPRKSIDTFGQRTSIYRGVTRHRWTGRYEAHLWDNSCRREGQTRKGRQVYLGGYDKEEKAARAYDLAALKYWGTTTTTNFPITNYEKEIEEMKHMTRQEYVASLRRKSSGFSRGASIYRGVTRHHQHGRWQARIGRVAGNKDLYLGTFSTQEEAAEAYDIAAIKFRGLNAVTNFEISRYDVKSILESTTLPIGGAAKRLKDAENAEMALEMHRANEASLNLHLTDGSYDVSNNHGWPNSIAFQQTAPAHQPLSMYPYGRFWPCKQEQDSDVSIGFNDNNIHHHLGNTQNFLQPSVLHNLMSLDSSSMDQHSSGSSSCLYNGGGTNGGGGSGFAFPMMGTVVVQDGNQNQGGNGNFVTGNDHEGMFGSSTADHTYPQVRSLLYQSQQPSSNGTITKAGSLYDQGSTCNTWIPTAVPTLATRANSMAVCHGASTFTVWNDT